MKKCDSFDSEKYRTQLGTRIHQIRVKKGFSQDKVAEAAGFSRGTMSKIEGGIVDPKATTLARIAKCLRVSVDELTP